MKHSLWLPLACASFAIGIAADARAHGGRYIGRPTDVVPPRPGGGGRPGAPGVPGVPGVPGSPSNPGGPHAGPSTGGGLEPGLDLTRWEFWWEIHKAPFIELKHAAHAVEVRTGSDVFSHGAGRLRGARDTLKPSDAQLSGEIVPALARALDSTEQRDLTSACMVALAKAGRVSAEIDLRLAFRARLRANDQEIRETAALAMGIAQGVDTVPDLVALVRDDPAGRSLVDGREVTDRTRAFAAYALGLIGWATDDATVDATALDCLSTVLTDGDRAGGRNLQVAAIHAVGLLRPDPRTEPGRVLATACLDLLEGYWKRDLGIDQQVVQAHVPTAIARLAREIDAADNPRLAVRIDRCREDWIDEVLGRSERARSIDLLVQSSIIALGRTSAPDRGDGTLALDRAASAAVLQCSRHGQDQQARYFALMALGQIGGVRNRDALLDVLRSGTDALERPWAALALGVMSFQERAETAGVRSDLVGNELRKQLRVQENPGAVGAIAIALGLCAHAPVADELRELLVDQQHQDELAGHLCIALALLGDHRSVPLLRDLVTTSARRPGRMQQAAVALGKLGDKEAAILLLELLNNGGQDLVRLSAIATALGSIGDRRIVDPLIGLLFDESVTDLSRAFAAAALGGVADKELLPWNSKIGSHSNYRAAVETLTNGVSGILDIL